MNKLTKRNKVAVLVVAGVTVLAVGGGLAIAYWSSTGTGTGTGTTGTSTSFTVAASAPTGGPMTPGGTGESVAFTVTNPGSGSQNLSSVVVTVAGAGGAAWTSVAGCSSADYTVGTPVIAYGQIAAGATVAGTVTIGMNNLATSQDGCKLAAVPMYFVAS